MRFGSASTAHPSIRQTPIPYEQSKDVLTKWCTWVGRTTATKVVMCVLASRRSRDGPADLRIVTGSRNIGLRAFHSEALLIPNPRLHQQLAIGLPRLGVVRSRLHLGIHRALIWAFIWALIWALI